MKYFSLPFKVSPKETADQQRARLKVFLEAREHINSSGESTFDSTSQPNKANDDDAPRLTVNYASSSSRKRPRRFILLQ